MILASAGYDVGLDNNRYRDRVWLVNNGTRNLVRVGTGVEADFQRLVKGFSSWMIEDLAAAAKKADIVLDEKGASYWTPGVASYSPGLISEEALGRGAFIGFMLGHQKDRTRG